jgi:phosphoribosylaminoimidazolecarboxamide formyltransferase / IMP cyclohydrolase
MTNTRKFRALISVSDKEGIVPFAKGLEKLNYEIISTGGTYKVLAENGVKVIPIDDVTKFPEMLDGRVKTLHPNIHGGLLSLRENKVHMDTCKEHGIELIDLVVVNLYPFQKTIEKEGVPLAEAIENIDIGGPSMIRSASKNYQSVGVVVDPKNYDRILVELKDGKGKLTDITRAELACEAFTHTAKYDTIISTYLTNKISGEEGFPRTFTPTLTKTADLRYGENPHQGAAFYTLDGGKGLTNMKQLHGKELSYNNIVDIEAAALIVKEFDIPGASIIKHTNPCGAAIGDTLSEAYTKAHSCDPTSAFGSIVGLNRNVDLKTATAISETFVEAVIAPKFDADALALLSKKPSIRLIELADLNTLEKGYFYKYVDGGFLVQSPDNHTVEESELTHVTKEKASKQQINDLLFAFKLVKYVKSNAILVAKDGMAIGVGAGQMSRVEAVEIALKKAGKDSKGAVLASDAFFPFKDSVELAAKAGISAVIQPGGSKRDPESIEACDAHGMTMVMTGIRHFRH